MRFVPLVVVGLAAVVSESTLAAERTGLTFAETALEVDYSQAVPLELLFVDKDGAPLDGTVPPGGVGACGGSPCRVEVTIRIADNSQPAFDVTAPDVAVDAAGRARVRLTLVDGRHGGATFKADPEGEPYTLTARFRGVGSPLPADDDEDCAAGADDGRLCPAEATATLNVFPEVPSLVFGEDIVMDVGDTVTLAATLVDDNGDAEVGGDDIDGPGRKVLEGFILRFAYDANDDGNPNFINEKIGGDVVTNAAGVGAIEFFADPAFAQAGVYDAGLFAEFPGDDRYAVARTAVKLTLNAGGPDPARTIIEVDPETLPADGVSEASIRVRLVDEDGNLLGPDAPPHDVAITTSLGLLQDTVERDVLDGTYTQQLRVQRKGGTAQIEVTVDGEDAGSAALVIEGAEGCTCNGGGSGASVLFGLSLLALGRRNKRSRRK